MCSVRVSQYQRECCQRRNGIRLGRNTRRIRGQKSAGIHSTLTSHKLIRPKHAARTHCNDFRPRAFFLLFRNPSILRSSQTSYPSAVNSPKKRVQLQSSQYQHFTPSDVNLCIEKTFPTISKQLF